MSQDDGLQQIFAKLASEIQKEEEKLKEKPLGKVKNTLIKNFCDDEDDDDDWPSEEGDSDIPRGGFFTLNFEDEKQSVSYWIFEHWKSMTIIC